MWACATIIVFALAPAFSQDAPPFPAWLESYSGAPPTVRSSGLVRESSYTSSAQPADIVAFYRSRFAAAGLSFQIRPEAVGTSLLAAANECDLAIRIQSFENGSSVVVTCSPHAAAETPARQPHWTRVDSSPAGPSQPVTGSEMMQRHQQVAAEMRMNQVRHDAPAPPLVWPSWLVNISGSEPRAQSGVDQSKNAMLKARYTTTIPMTELFNFYRDLLNAHEYPARGRLSTGHTMTGIQQNAFATIEGSNYPDGAPGAYSVIGISLDRSVLNGPITVTIRFTTHDFIAKRGY